MIPPESEPSIFFGSNTSPVPTRENAKRTSDLFVLLIAALSFPGAPQRAMVVIPVFASIVEPAGSFVLSTDTVSVEGAVKSITAFTLNGTYGGRHINSLSLL